MELVHLDISGPVDKYLEGIVYTVIFLDDFTQSLMSKFLRIDQKFRMPQQNRKIVQKSRAKCLELSSKMLDSAKLVKFS